MKKKNTETEINLSIVVPVFNESRGIVAFHNSLQPVLDDMSISYELIYVDDGSWDESGQLVQDLARRDSTVQPLLLSRNFGKEAATTAGLHHAVGNAIIVIDADGQHPVELIPKFLEHWKKGAKVVVGMRTSNSREGLVKHFGSKLFYQLLKILRAPHATAGTTDFRLIDREVQRAFNKLSEHNRITRALIDWLGYDRDYIYFKAKPREHGEPSYSLRKLVQLALNGFVSLSFTPLYFSGYVGVFITMLSFIMSIFAIIEKYVLGDPMGLNITGTAILGVMTLFLVGILLIGQGLLAIYVARIYTEVQSRPLYVVKS